MFLTRDATKFCHLNGRAFCTIDAIGVTLEFMPFRAVAYTRSAQLSICFAS
jgi:hypothetical protein